MHDILSGELIPVLLGISAEAHETAHRMYREYGVLSHVFCSRVPLAMRFNLCMKFHMIRHTAHEQLMLRALIDFAEQLGNADVILYLIPCTEPFANFVWQHKDLLERRFVIADRPEMLRVWFGEETQKIAGKEEIT
ncbi:MAG: hypothetical protein E7666_05180 [Ruminococcaceae bacterium]|nr:hypothetical protein [Oscillospiraceae bacterium]